MIIGIGNDLVDIGRIEKTLERFGDRFIHRIFTEVEQAKADRRKAIPRVYASTFAKRFAAKEACSKALGTGFRRGIFWRDLGVENSPSGQPTLTLTGGAANHLATLVPKGMDVRVNLTMTDDYPWAEAMVIIEAVPAGLGNTTP